ncbi:hypothetical protein LTA00_13375 [Lactiplantibacillus plantarum]|uniref:hypothetical protein n=1 Tax=Lactiplantibacillus plantarum TaxID=1590 RepID=UPI0020033E2D|nr:hypothetical protein [Lactiplantibacillus plantarum]MCK6240571.1 hypothetical protein [Lactiplantibacillus plantarum]
MANRKRKPINIDSNQEGEKFDTLFSSKETPIKNISPEQEEVRLQQFDKIRNFFKRDKRQKQYSVYLPESIQKMIKRHAILEDKSFSQVTKELFLDHYLTDSEIKAAYNEDYDKRHHL